MEGCNTTNDAESLRNGACRCLKQANNLKAVSPPRSVSAGNHPNGQSSHRPYRAYARHVIVIRSTNEDPLTVNRIDFHFASEWASTRKSCQAVEMRWKERWSRSSRSCYSHPSVSRKPIRKAQYSLAQPQAKPIPLSPVGKS
jgi:hypothetical protein